MFRRIRTRTSLAITRLKRLRLLLVAVLVLLCAAEIAGAALIVLDPPSYRGPRSFWQYQCIDTQKTSRDQARAWAKRADLARVIDQQMSLIAAAGANCVVIDTPYDQEFRPVLKAWVAGARARHLRVWFRGSFSAWEGWFDYPQGMTADELMSETQAFITGNPGLFADDDVFSAAPEADSGALLATESSRAAVGFGAIHKRVITNWAAMNGGLARDTLDQATVKQLDGTVTIDHFVAGPADMGSIVDHFVHRLGARVVVGEWGAPVPDINGTMTPSQQASFVRSLLQQLAARDGSVVGINYWSLSDGSSALADGNLRPLPVFDVIRSYYRPAVLVGTVRNGNRPARNAVVTVDGVLKVNTDRNGQFALLVPSGAVSVTAAQGRSRYRGEIHVLPGASKTVNISLKP